MHVLDALGNPVRRAILRELRAGPRAVGEIAAGLPVSRPAVSRHLRLLKEAGLVLEEARGTRRLYSLHSQGVEAVEAYLTQVWGDVATRFRLMADNTPPGTRQSATQSAPRGKKKRRS